MRLLRRLQRRAGRGKIVWPDLVQSGCGVAHQAVPQQQDAVCPWQDPAEPLDAGGENGDRVDGAAQDARRFEEFKGTGISDNILTVRLKRLVEAGVFERSRYQQRPDSCEYLLTAKGKALGPVVAALRDWVQRGPTAPTGPRWAIGPAATRSPSGFTAPTATGKSPAPRSARSINGVADSGLIST